MRAAGACSRFIGPETLADWLTQELQHPGSTLRARLRHLPALIDRWAAASADHGHPQPGKIARRAAPAGADPDGQRRRQDLHGVQFHLSADQVRRRPAHPVPGGPRQPRPADAQGVPAVRHARGESASSPSCTTSSTCRSNKLDDVSQRLHHHHPAPLLHAEGRGGVRPELEEESLFTLACAACKKPVPVGYNPAFPSRLSISSSPTSATAPSTISGGRCWNTSTPSLIGLTATPSKQTLGFFNQNLVMEYSHEQAVADRRERRLRRLPHPHARSASTARRSTPASTWTSATARPRKVRWEQLDERLHLRRQPARPRRGRPGPDPHRHPHLQATGCSPRSSPAAPKCPRP